MLYRFNIELSDIDKGLYTSLDFRLAQHPSETGPYLLTRVLAYILSYEEDLKFSAGGLSDPDAPALLKLGLQNSIELWIEIGNPSARKLHKANKNAKKVVIYTYKNPEVLIEEIRVNEVHKASELQIYSLDSQFLLKLELSLKNNNKWSVIFQQGQLDIIIDDQAYSTVVRPLTIADSNANSIKS